MLCDVPGRSPAVGNEMDAGESVDVIILARVIDLLPSHEADEDTRVHDVRQLDTSHDTAERRY